MSDHLNLTPDRGPNVWGASEGGSWRLALAAGALLAGGVAAAFIGARMLYRAASASREAKMPGRDVVRRGRTHMADTPPGATLLRRAADAPPWSTEDVTGSMSDLVEQESMESFPASDAPSWTVSDGPKTERRR